RFEPAVHRSIEYHAASGGEHAAPDREVLVDMPYGLPRGRIPSVQPAAMPTRSGVHLHARTDVRRPRDVIGLDAFVVHAVVRIREVEPSRRGRERARGLVLAPGGRGTDPARHDALLGAIGGIFDRPAGAQIDAFRPI